ncbi:sigma-70 family RNA polymerase sigma factor [Haliangium ochraceum]|uniref:sigma-70 family RNA polymerase sigma factor n=1 Tax=Haliangium ochraceum TaxID=80816 RepID=UPI0018EF8DCB|nr:sigma-70 family RNA polymerase sigma factor [Haliangium ochraceum]
MSSLAQPFLNALAEPLRPAFAQLDGLEARLAELLAEGREAWSALAVAPAEFAAFLGARLPADKPADPALSGLRAADLYLACACASGDESALRAFDERYMREVDIGLARMNVSATQVDEVKQLVRHKLFLARDGGVGKITDYSGRGDLRRWVRSIAVRTCLNELRRHKRMIPSSDERLFEDMSTGDDDPELQYMKERYRSQFQEAFASAVKLLSDREQTLLRYHHVDGLNIDEIGAIYRVHRVTAYRWLEKARGALVDKLQELLAAKLAVESRDYQSILRLIRSQLHLSLVRHLGDARDSRARARARGEDDDAAE